jgi:hypothetical protein
LLTVMRLRYILYSAWLRLSLFRKKDDRPAAEQLLDLLPLVLATSIFVSAIAYIGKTSKKVMPVLWIKKGRTVKAFPVLQALRIARKYHWQFVETEPVRHVSRWGALKVIIAGDRKCHKSA